MMSAVNAAVLRSAAFEGFVCDDCHAEYTGDDLVTTCPACGGFLESRYDLDRVDPETFFPDARAQRHLGVLRWHELYPDGIAAQATMGEGGSPLIRLPRASDRYGCEVLAKYDGGSPTGSFKDRGFALAVGFAQARGLHSAYTYSSGNAGASFAAYASRVGMDATVFVESIANPDKIAAIKAYGAAVFRITFTSSAEIYNALDYLSQRGVYTFTNFVNPVRHEAMKSYAYELYEDLDGQAPDIEIHPVGTGGGIWGAWRGFTELRALGLLERLPRMIGVQPAEAGPLPAAFAGGLAECGQDGNPAKTVAQSIATDTMSHGGRRPLRAIYESDGRAVAVPEKEILESLTELGRDGLLVEPSSAAAFGALKHFPRSELSGRRVVIMLTGNGLKAAHVLRQHFGQIDGTVDARGADWEGVMNHE